MKPFKYKNDYFAAVLWILTGIYLMFGFYQFAVKSEKMNKGENNIWIGSTCERCEPSDHNTTSKNLSWSFVSGETFITILKYSFILIHLNVENSRIIHRSFTKCALLIIFLNIKEGMHSERSWYTFNILLYFESHKIWANQGKKDFYQEGWNNR